MHHHNQLEKFMARGREAQEAVDKILSGGPSSHAAPADSGYAGPGASDKRRPGPVRVGDHVPVQDVIDCIEQNDNPTWLRKLMANADNPFAVRVAAEKRLKVLYKRTKGAKL